MGYGAAILASGKVAGAALILTLLRQTKAAWLGTRKPAYEAFRRG